MPIIQSDYNPILWWRNAHFSTIVPSIFRKKTGVNYTRERLELSDGDFIDLDWSYTQNSDSKLVILTHGLLGDSRRGYILGAVKAFNAAGYDALAWNHRGLSGEPNRFERMTIHGSSDDLGAVVSHALNFEKYNEIVLVGYSKGGNITLKYAGEQGENIAKKIKTIVAVSSPIDMQGSVDAMSKDGFYANRFRAKLYKFLKARTTLIDAKKIKEFDSYKYLDDFTEYYIAPLHGFKNAADYYAQTSSLGYLEAIRVPTLILNAQNDPVLSASCSPADKAKNSPYLFLETPKYGGHCAFYQPHKNQIYWADERVVAFCKN
jgi:uncharacterized protein